MSIDGTPVKMSPELQSLLNQEQWYAQSFTSSTGRLGLVLSSYEARRIKRVARVEIHANATIASYRDLKVRKCTDEEEDFTDLLNSPEPSRDRRKSTLAQSR